MRVSGGSPKRVREKIDRRRDLVRQPATTGHPGLTGGAAAGSSRALRHPVHGSRADARPRQPTDFRVLERQRIGLPDAQRILHFAIGVHLDLQAVVFHGLCVILPEVERQHVQTAIRNAPRDAQIALRSVFGYLPGADQDREFSDSAK